nr:MAG: capsid protein [Virus sp.]
MKYNVFSSPEQKRIRYLARHFPDYEPYQERLNQLMIAELRDTLTKKKNMVSSRRSSRTSPSNALVRSASRSPALSRRSSLLSNISPDMMMALADIAMPQLSPALSAARRASSVAGSMYNMTQQARRFMRKGQKSSPVTPTLAAAARARGSRKWLSASTGFYKGGFKKPRKTNSPKVETKCLKKGYHVTLEVHGRVEDQHCAYMQHSTWNSSAYANVIAGALVRKLFKKAGIQMDQADQEVIGTTAFNAKGWALEYIVYNPANGQTSTYPVYNTLDNDTLDGIINDITKFTVLKGHITNFLNNAIGFEDERQEPYQLNLYRWDADTDIQTYHNQRPAATINLVNEYVEVYASSTMKIQNRTAGDLASAADRYQLDRIDNQPLKGYCYEYYGEPRLKYPRVNNTTGFDQINYSDENAVTLWKASGLPSAYIEPPVPAFWANCSKNSRVILQPGELKKGYIATKYKGKLVNVLKKIRCERNTAGRITGAKGKTQLFAFEEKIRTPGTNPITLQYESELKVGAFTKTGSNSPFQSSYTSTLKDRL